MTGDRQAREHHRRLALEELLVKGVRQFSQVSRVWAAGSRLQEVRFLQRREHQRRTGMLRSTAGARGAWQNSQADVGWPRRAMRSQRRAIFWQVAEQKRREVRE